jgi:hypothetical protein
MVRFFLSKGGTLNSPRSPAQRKMYMPLLSAMKSVDETTVKTLLDAGADPNGCLHLCRPLVDAVWKGSTTVVKVLLD